MDKIGRINLWDMLLYQVHLETFSFFSNKLLACMLSDKWQISTRGFRHEMLYFWWFCLLFINILAGLKVCINLLKCRYDYISKEWLSVVFIIPSDPVILWVYLEGINEVNLLLKPYHRLLWVHGLNSSLSLNYKYNANLCYFSVLIYIIRLADL